MKTGRSRLLTEVKLKAVRMKTERRKETIKIKRIDASLGDAKYARTRKTESPLCPF